MLRIKQHVFLSVGAYAKKTFLALKRQSKEEIPDYAMIVMTRYTNNTKKKDKKGNFLDRRSVCRQKNNVSF